MKSTINWGIIGLGKIAHKFASDLKLVPDARLHAVASSNNQRATDFARQYGAQYHFSSYEGLLNCPHLDVVYIATNHPQHCAVTLMCLKKRIPVLCEKPFGMNAHEVKMMIDTAKANKTFLMEALWTRCIPAFQKAMNLVKNGTIGRPLSIKADFGFAAPFNPNNRIYNKDLGASSLLDIGIYPILLSQSVFGGKPTRIQAMAQMSVTDIDETCAMNLQYAEGGIAMCHSSVVADSKIEAFIYGEEGVLHIHSRFHHPQKLTVTLYHGRGEENYFLPFEGNGYQFEIMEVNKCLKNSELESTIIPHSFSTDLIETLDAVRKEIGLVFPKYDV
jgi:predicted dehydrogenase